MMNILCGAVVVGGGRTRIFLICPAMSFLVDGGSAVAARWQQHGGGRQCGGGVGNAAVGAAERWPSVRGSAENENMGVCAVCRPTGANTEGAG